MFVVRQPLVLEKTGAERCAGRIPRRRRDLVVTPGAPLVLLVDDDPAVRSSLKFALELDGFAVELFCDGEALSRRETLPAHACLLIDHRLPGIDGLSLLTLLRARGSALPAIIITSNPTQHVRERAAAAGALLIEKPLFGDALADVLRAVLQHPRGEQ